MMKKRLCALCLALALACCGAWSAGAEEEEPRLALNALVRYPKDSYPLTPLGMTDEIPCLLTVTNTGEAPCELSYLRVQIRDRWYAYPLRDTVLEKGQSFTCVFGHHIYRDDLLPGTEAEGILGAAETVFTVTSGEYGQYSSNEARLSLRVSDGLSQDLSPDESQQVQLALSVAGASVHPAGYQAGEKVNCRVTVTNRSAQTLSGLSVLEIPGADGEGREIGLIDSLAPGEEKTLVFAHTVQESEALQGYVYTAAAAAWTDPARGDALQSLSAPAVAMTLAPAAAPRLSGDGVQLTVALANAPGSGAYYTPGETARLSLRAVNASSSPLYHVTLSDVTADGAAAEIPALLPGEEAQAELEYTVTELDALLGRLWAVAEARASDVYGNQAVYVSQPFAVPVSQPELDGAAGSLTLLQRETSSPARGSAYRAGETIQYEIILLRGAEEGPVDLWACSSLAEDISGHIERVEQFMPGDFAFIPFQHTVTEAEEAAGCVVSWAFAQVERDGVPLGVCRSENPLVTPAGSGSAASQGGFALPLAGDGCALTLLSTGSNAAEYSQRFCARHAELVKSVHDLTAAAETEEALLSAWEQAVILWTEDLENLYGEYLAAASGEARMAVMQERSACLDSLSSLRTLLNQLYAGDPASAAQATAEETMQRCLALCGGGHSASSQQGGAAREAAGRIVSTGTADACSRMTLLSQDEAVQYRDLLCGAHSRAEEAAAVLLKKTDGSQNAVSLWSAALQSDLNARFGAAGAQARAAAARFALSLDRYLAARAETLSLLSPNDPAAAGEAGAQTAMRCVLALCREGRD